MNYRTPRTKNKETQDRFVDIGVVGIPPIWKEKVTVRVVKVTRKNISAKYDLKISLKGTEKITTENYQVACESCGYEGMMKLPKMNKNESGFIEAHCPSCKSRYSLMFKKI